jgi:hypothetical protein
LTMCAKYDAPASFDNVKKSEIRISGTATFRRYSLPTQPTSRKGTRARFIK